MRKKTHSKISSDFCEAALEHLDALFRFAMVLPRNRAVAEALVQETCLRATRAFGLLSPERELEGFSYQQIATILQSPAGTVMSRRGRAREQLRARLCGWQVNPGDAMRRKREIRNP